jgi:RNA ligase
MHQFPKITNIKDVLPHIDVNFRVVEKEGITYINYVSLLPSIFPPVTDTASAIRRECRGIAFDTQTGNLVSRPFHKFFNMGEREDAQFIDEDHKVLHKLDGSMIRPLVHPDGTIRLGTKMGVTEVAMDAEAFVARRPEYLEFMKDMIDRDITPIFEYVGPHNRVVLEYEENLILLACRNLYSGEYFEYDTLLAIADVYDIPLVEHDTLEDVKSREGEEGVVVVYHNGHMLKVKSDWYVKVHRAKELLTSPRRFLEAIVNETIDDAIATFLEDDKKKALDRLQEFYESKSKETRFLELYYGIMRDFHKEKKDFAIDTKDLPDNIYRQLVFKLWDGKATTAEEAVDNWIASRVSSNERVQEVLKQLELDWI